MALAAGGTGASALAFWPFRGTANNAVGQRTHTDITIPAFTGTLTSHPSASGTVDYEYDPQGRLTREHSVRDNAGGEPEARPAGRDRGA